MLETIKAAIQDNLHADPFAEFYQCYVTDLQDKIIEQEIQHISNLICNPEDKVAINSQIDMIAKELQHDIFY